jgi:hypothetical protein
VYTFGCHYRKKKSVNSFCRELKISFGTCQLVGLVTGFDGFPFNVESYIDIFSKSVLTLSLSLSPLTFPR